MKRERLRVAAFTGGRGVPSARFRVRQYVPHLRMRGVDLREFRAPLGAYPPSQKNLRPFWGVGSVVSRAPSIIRSFGYELTLLQREMLSTRITWEPLTKAPRVLDVDDAIWLNRPGPWTRKIANLCAGIICGNDFLAEHFSKWNRNVRVLPTGIDTDYFRPRELPKKDGRLVVGWSGTSSGFPYLYEVEYPLATILKANGHVVFKVLADKRPVFHNIPLEQFEFVPWSAENEIVHLQDMDIGIMPLGDSDWARGKCSFKMLSYMACEIPVIVSPFGMNGQVLSLGSVGLEASDAHDWMKALDLLIRDKALRTQMGRVGREVVIQHYAVKVLAPKLADMLFEFSKGG